MVTKMLMEHKAMVTKMLMEHKAIIFVAMLGFIATVIAFATGVRVGRSKETTPAISWLSISKDAEGKLNGVMIRERTIPSSLLATLPQTREDAKVTTREEVREVMQKHHMFDHRQINDQLRYNDNSITYWTKRSLSRWELELEFLSRHLLLEEADRADVIIVDHGKLSYWAKRIYEVLIQHVPNQQK